MMKVVPDDHVIDEGDDGDNFYVIDRSVTECQPLISRMS